MSQQASQPEKDDLGAVIYTLGKIFLGVLLVGLCAAYAVTARFDTIAEDRADPALAATHIVTIGAQHYVVPAALLADPAQRRDGFAERMDMTLVLPIGPDSSLREIDVAITSRGRVRTSANLLDAVYMRQFAPEQLGGIPGLVGKPLQGDAGIGGETVWYDPLSATPFAAKCMAPVADIPHARTCLRTAQLSDRNIAIYTFAPDVLANWRQFDTVIENWLQTLRK